MNTQLQTKVKVRLVFKRLAGYFLQGLLYAAPLGFTIFFIYRGFGFVDEILKPYLKEHFHLVIPGLGLIILVSSITILGFVGQTVIAQPFKIVLEGLIKRTPILNTVYSFLHDFMEAFVGKDKKFNQPVRVIVCKEPEIERFGFITQNDLTELGIKDKVAVYLPWSYNFSGEMYIVPSECVFPVDIHPSEMMKFILSGGVTRV